MYGLFNDTVNSTASVASDLRNDCEYCIGRDIEGNFHGQKFWYCGESRLGSVEIGAFPGVV
jgi:hypothetical protein